jgi:hypothetical protein
MCEIYHYRNPLSWFEASGPFHLLQGVVYSTQQVVWRYQFVLNWAVSKI